MKSLRTDDIIGAMPRVRHMPKNLFRQQRSYPSNHSVQYSPIKDYDSYYKDIGGKWDHSYNENIYGNFPLSQYDPNPFIKQPQIDKSNSSYPKGNESTRYQQQSYQNRQHEELLNQSYQKYQRPYSNEYQLYQKQFISKLEQKDVKKKQALYTNYDQLKQWECIKNNQGMSRQNCYPSQVSNKMSANEINQNYRQNPQYNQINKQSNTMKYNLTRSQESPNIDKEEIINSARGMGSRASSDKNNNNSRQKGYQSREKQQKNIFRGIGFNIITNSKYQYNMQTKNPYLKQEN